MSLTGFSSSSSSSIPRTTKVVLLTGANTAMMAGAALIPSMPAMMEEFVDLPGAGFWVAMIITLPALFVVLGGPMIGWFTDRFGRKPALVASLLLGGLGGTAAVFLNSITAILFTRALVGLSIAGSTTATNALIADYFQGQARAKFMGIQSAIAGFAGMIFLPIGGILADLDWHYSFFAYLPLIVLFFLSLFFIHEPQAVVNPDGSAVEVKLRLTSTQVYIFAAGFLSQFSFITLPVFSAYFLTDLLQVSSTSVGLISAVSSFFSFLGGLLYDPIGRKASFREVAILGFFLFGGGFLVFGLATSWALVILGQVIIGFCLGLTNSNLPTWLAHEINPQVRGRANGIYVTMIFLGQFFASIILTPIVNGANLHVVFLISAAILGLTGLVGVWLGPQEDGLRRAG